MYASTRPITQAVRHSTSEWRRQVLAGGYWLRDYRAQPVMPSIRGCTSSRQG